MADEEHYPLGWSASRAQENEAEKTAMAKHWVNHGFLIQDGKSPESMSRERAASILVNPGTTPNTVASEALKWMADEWTRRGPFQVVWYTPGALVPATLRRFKDRNQKLRSAADLFLFPGQVDPDVESVLGDVAVNFINDHQTTFTYSILSAYGLDMESSNAYFHYAYEVPLQRACAQKYARHKVLFLDATKFRREGEPAYDVTDLLSTAQNLTIYTHTSSRNERILDQFDQLAERVLDTKNTGGPDAKVLQLCIVNGETIVRTVHGTLRKRRKRRF